MDRAPHPGRDARQDHTRPEGRPDVTRAIECPLRGLGPVVPHHDRLHRSSSGRTSREHYDLGATMQDRALRARAPLRPDEAWPALRIRVSARASRRLPIRDRSGPKTSKPGSARRPARGARQRARAHEPDPLDPDGERVRELGRGSKRAVDVLGDNHLGAPRRGHRPDRHLDHVHDDERLASLDRRVYRERGRARIDGYVERDEHDRPGTGDDRRSVHRVPRAAGEHQSGLSCQLACSPSRPGPRAPEPWARRRGRTPARARRGGRRTGCPRRRRPGRARPPARGAARSRGVDSAARSAGVARSPLSGSGPCSTSCRTSGTSSARRSEPAQ